MIKREKLEQIRDDYKGRRKLAKLIQDSRLSSINVSGDKAKEIVDKVFEEVKQRRIRDEIMRSQAVRETLFLRMHI